MFLFLVFTFSWIEKARFMIKRGIERERERDRVGECSL